MQWWIGDWVNYGGKRYGETYKAAIDATGMGYSTVKNFSLVCNAFEMARRKANLTFNHHVAVWSLEPYQQDELLGRAEVEGLSCAKLREIVRSINCIAVTETSPDKCESDIATANDCETEQEWETACVDAFNKTEHRLNALREIVRTLQAHELQIVLEWIKELSP